MRDKTEAHIPEDPDQSLPFFARFLEGQDTTEVARMTLKYPSDRDEWDQRLDYSSSNNES
jgi:hypothetical protein